METRNVSEGAALSTYELAGDLAAAQVGVSPNISSEPSHIFDRTEIPARQWTLKLEHVTGYQVVGERFEHSHDAVSLGGLHLKDTTTLELITHQNTTVAISIAELKGELTWSDEFDWSHAAKRYRFRWVW